MESDQDSQEGEKQSFTLGSQTGTFGVTSQGMAAVADSPGRVDMNDFVGRASSWLDENGRIGVLIRDAPHRGTDGEPPVREVLRQVLATSDAAATVDLAEDGRGEDGVARLSDGSVLTVQIVVVPPDPLVNREISQGEMKRYLAPGEAAGWLHASIEHKLKIPHVQRPQIILVLDVRHLAAFVSDGVLAEFRTAYPDVVGYGFAQVWLIGPVPARCARLA